MTAPYARLSDKTVREHREKARKVNAEGQPVQISPDGPLSDAARAKRQLSCARSITPSGGPPSRSSPRPGRKGVMNRQVAVDLDKIITALEADGRRQPPMRPDPPGHPAKAAARRHELTRAKAIQALHELDRAGASHLRIRRRSSRDIPVLALYQADIHSYMSACDGQPRSAAIPDRQRATDASLRSRLAVALERNHQLSEENGPAHRRQLARALGEQCSAWTRSGSNPTA